MTTQDPAFDELQSRVDVVLTQGKGDKINVCYVLFEILERCPDNSRTHLLKYLAGVFGEVESSEELDIDQYMEDEYISENEVHSLKRKYGEVVDSMLKVLISENPPEDKFYEELWNLVNNPLLEGKKSKVFALYWVLIDKRIPYFHLDRGQRMANQDFAAIYAKIQRSRAKVRFILSLDFDQRTEEADLVLREILKLEGDERLVLMVDVIRQLGMRDIDV